MLHKHRYQRYQHHYEHRYQGQQHRYQGSGVRSRVGDVDSGVGDVDSGVGDVDSGVGDVGSGVGDVGSGVGDFGSGVGDVGSGTPRPTSPTSLPKSPTPLYTNTTTHVNHTTTNTATNVSIIPAITSTPPMLPYRLHNHNCHNHQCHFRLILIILNVLPHCAFQSIACTTDATQSACGYASSATPDATLTRISRMNLYGAFGLVKMRRHIVSWLAGNKLALCLYSHRNGCFRCAQKNLFRPY